MKPASDAPTIRFMLADDDDLVRSGIKAISQIHSSHPDVRVLVLSMYDTVDFVRRAAAKGACGDLMKDAPPFELEQAVRSVMATGSYFSPAIGKGLVKP